MKKENGGTTRRERRKKEGKSNNGALIYMLINGALKNPLQQSPLLTLRIIIPTFQVCWLSCLENRITLSFLQEAMEQEAVNIETWT